MIASNNRLQRRKLLRFKSETFLRPNQMNLNVAAWSRLMKNEMFGNQFSNTAKSFAYLTPETRKRLDERSSSTESSSSTASISHIKLEKADTKESFREEDENELDEDDEEDDEKVKNKITDDKLKFIKQLNEQKKQDQIEEIEIASLSTSEEEVDLIDYNMTVTLEGEEENKTKKSLVRSKTENLRPQKTIRGKPGALKLDLNIPAKETTKIESIDDSDDEAEDSDLDADELDKTDSNIIELDDDDLEDKNEKLNNEHPLSKLNLMQHEERKDPLFEQKESEKWETKDLKLSDFSFISTLGKGKENR